MLSGSRLLPQEPFGQVRVGDHLERAEVCRGRLDQRAAARLFRGMRIVHQQLGVPVARGGLEQTLKPWPASRPTLPVCATSARETSADRP